MSQVRIETTYGELLFQSSVERLIATLIAEGRIKADLPIRISISIEGIYGDPITEEHQLTIEDFSTGESE